MQRRNTMSSFLTGKNEPHCFYVFHFRAAACLMRKQHNVLDAIRFDPCLGISVTQGD